jgi:predicted secreted hydrolase
MAHLAVTSVAAGTHREFQRIARGHPRLAGVRSQPFAAYIDGWSLKSTGRGFAPLRLQAREGASYVDLELLPGKPLVLQGDRGLSMKGPQQGSYYYSFPRLLVRGVLGSEGETHRVVGTAWLDREWSTSSLAAEHAGWDWFALQFADGEEWMAFQLRRRHGGPRDPYDYAVRIDRDGVARVLAADEFAMTPTRWWRDERGVSWPVAWRLSAGGVQVDVAAALDDQRMDTAVVYWEGLVIVRDMLGETVGSGYMELTGYGQ